MKSILKRKNMMDGSKCTRNKLPLRVTFLLDQQYTQKQNSIKSQTMSWMDKNSQENCNDTLIIQNHAQLQKETKGTEGFWSDNQFKRENIIWRNFILVYNPKFQLDTFHCGKCKQTFNRVIDFTFHCLAQCGEISNCSSSHFIFEETDWKRMIERQRKKVGENSSGDKSTYQSRMQEVKDFTRTTLDFWRKVKQAENFIYEQHYIYEFKLILLLNPHAEGYSQLSISQCMKACLPRREHRRNNYILEHFYGNCCQVNMPKSTFLLLDAQLFYSYLFQIRNRQLLVDQTDMPYLLYLYAHSVLKQKIQQKYPRLRYLRIYIELFFNMRRTLAETTGSKNSKQAGYERPNILVQLKSRRIVSLSQNWNNLKGQTFYCPCQKFETPMTLQEFSDHLKKAIKHEPIRISDIFS